MMWPLQTWLSTYDEEVARALQLERDVSSTSFAPLSIMRASRQGDSQSFDAGHGEEPGRVAPRASSAAAASTPKGSAVRVDYLRTGKSYVFLESLAEVCGVDAHELHFRYRPNHWGCPGHWVLQAGRTCYAECALPELAAELEAHGQPASAAKLRSFIESLSAGRGGTAPGIELEPVRTTAAPAQAEPWYRKGALA